MYQVKNHVNYSSNEKADMFKYLCLDLSNSNQEKLFLIDELKSLKENLFVTENSLSLMTKDNSCLSLTNKYILCGKEKPD